MSDIELRCSYCHRWANVTDGDAQGWEECDNCMDTLCEDCKLTEDLNALCPYCAEEEKEEEEE